MISQKFVQQDLMRKGGVSFASDKINESLKYFISEVPKYIKELENLKKWPEFTQLKKLLDYCMAYDFDRKRLRENYSLLNSLKEFWSFNDSRIQDCKNFLQAAKKEYKKRTGKNSLSLGIDFDEPQNCRRSIHFDRYKPSALKEEYLKAADIIKKIMSKFQSISQKYDQLFWKIKDVCQMKDVIPKFKTAGELSCLNPRNVSSGLDELKILCRISAYFKDGRDYHSYYSHDNGSTAWLYYDD